jgi:hypothetical protein
MTINSRLLTSGCSCTDYCWSTWADFLGLEFNEFLNVGQAGSDNANIARNVIDHARPKDFVVILWTGWNRQVLWNDKGCPISKDLDNHWQYNYERWSKNWLVNFYSPVERFVNSMDYIRLVDLHSKVVGYTAYHFSTFPWMLGEIEKDPHKEFENFYKKYKDITNLFLQEQSLEEFQLQNYNIIVSNWDTHPTPLCHLNYLNKVIAPKLKINLMQKDNIKIQTLQQLVMSDQRNFTKSKQEMLGEQYE